MLKKKEEKKKKKKGIKSNAPLNEIGLRNLVLHSTLEVKLYCILIFGTEANWLLIQL